MLIGEKIKFIREQKALSQSEMGDSLYVSSQAVSNWERGKSYPDLKNIIRISELYGISLEELMLEDVDYKKVLVEKKIDSQVDMGFNVFFMIILMVFISYAISNNQYNGYVLVSIAYVAYLAINMVQSVFLAKNKKGAV